MKAFSLGIVFLIGALMIFDENIQKVVQGYRSRTTDDLAKVVKPLGDGWVVVPVFLGLSLLGSTLNNPTALELGVTTLKSLTASGISTGTLQMVFGRERPIKEKGSNSYNLFKGGGSFPSGHTSVAFTVATVLSQYYKTYGVVPVLSYSLAGLVGFSRVNDNKHFASDVVAGAVLGVVMTRWILQRRKRPKQGTPGTKTSLRILLLLTGISLEIWILPKQAVCQEPFSKSSVNLAGLRGLNPIPLAKDIERDSLAFVMAPARFTFKDWLITGMTLGGIGILMIFDEDLQESMQNHRSRATDEVSKIAKPFGDGKVAVPIFLGLSLVGGVLDRSSLKDFGATALDSLAVAGIFTEALKVAFGRARPIKGKGSGSYDPFSSRDSFPSGHTSVAFAMATDFSDQYKGHQAVPILSYSLAGLVGFSRINDNEHFASDVLAGAALGIATAKLVLRRHQNRRLSLVPQISEDHQGLAIHYRW